MLVQTRLPDHEVLRAAVEGNPGIVASHELAVRRQLSLPPAGALALVSGAAAGTFATALSQLTALEVSDLGEGRWMVRAVSTTSLCDALATVPRPAGRLRVEVDPTAL